MKEKESSVFGLLGKNISYSFSRGFFTDKFKALNFKKNKYVNFDIQQIEDFPSIINKEQNLKGLNVTIPYKEEVIKYLDKLDTTAKKIGAVNTIKFTKRGNLKGYNSDVVGFENSIKPLLKKHHKKALILGTGGASKAIAFIIQNNIFDGQIYNVLTTNTTVRNVVDTIKEFVPNLEVEFVDNRIMNQLSYEVMSDRFKSKGFVFSGNMRRGIKETINLLKHANHI